MLSLSPAEVILFQKNASSIEYSGNVEILNISKKPITYKVGKNQSINMVESIDAMSSNKIVTFYLTTKSMHEIACKQQITNFQHSSGSFI